MTHPFRTLLSIVTTFSVALACSQHATENADSGVSVEALRGAQASYQSFSQTATDCYNQYKSCLTAPTTEIDCRSQLTACLPTQAPTPPKCATGTGGTSGTSGAGGTSSTGENGSVQLLCHTAGSGNLHRDAGVSPPSTTPPSTTPPSTTPPGTTLTGNNLPGWCTNVPLPPTTELNACTAAMKGCMNVAQSELAQSCVDLFQQCAKQLYTSSFNTLCRSIKQDCTNLGEITSCDIATQICAGGVTDPVVVY